MATRKEFTQWDREPLVAISSSIRPYLFDLPQLMSLPNGFEFRFRYQHKWVADEVKTELAKSKGDREYRGRRLIVMYHSRDTCRLVPVRECEVLRIEALGHVVLLRFRLGNFVQVPLQDEYSVVPSLRDDHEAELAESVKAVLGHLLPDNPQVLGSSLAPGSYLSVSKAQPKEDPLWAKETYAKVEHHRRWAAVANVVGNEPGFKDIPIFYLLGFHRENGDETKPCSIKNRFSAFKEPVLGYLLTEGQRYRLRLLQWCTSDSTTCDVTCDFNDDLLELEGARSQVLGRYDVLAYNYRALKPGYCELAVKAKPECAAQPGPPPAPPPEGGSPRPVANDWPLYYAATIPVQIRHNWRRVFGVGVTGLAGLAVYFAAGPLVGAESVGAKALEVVGLLAALLAYGEFLGRFVKAYGGIAKLTSSASPDN